MPKPLEGIRIVDLSYHVAGPATTGILADWGADVIKVEPPFGEPGRPTGLSIGMRADDGCNPYFGIDNTNKRDISINLKTEAGKELLDEILGKSQAMVTNFRPEALKRMGLDYEIISKKHPHLVYGSVTGYGEKGPDKDAPGYDIVAFWARSGAMLDMVEASNVMPINPVWAFGDSATACSLAGGVAAGIIQQMRTGKGCKVFTSLYAQALYNCSSAISSVQFGDKYPRTRLRPATAMSNAYQCKDGTWINISLYEEPRFPEFLEKIAARPDLAANSEYNNVAGAKRNTEELVQIISAEVGKYTGDEMERKLKENDFAYSIIHHIPDTIHDMQALENGYISEYTHRDGTKTMMVNPPVKFDTTETSFRYDYPLCGEHTDEILKELGVGQERIDKLKEIGAVYQRELGSALA